MASSPKRRRKCISIVDDFIDFTYEDCESKIEFENDNWNNMRIMSGIEKKDDKTIGEALIQLFYTDNISQLELCLDNVKIIYDKCNERQRMAVRADFNCFVVILMQRAFQETIDEHIVLKVLNIAGEMFKTQSTGCLNYKDIAVLKVMFHAKYFKSKLECYKCGCVQKSLVELYNQEENKLLTETIHKLIVSSPSTSNGPITTVYSNSFQNKKNSLDVFVFYTEILKEFIDSSLIETTNESIADRCESLLGFLELYNPKECQYPEACKHLRTLFKNTVFRNKSITINYNLREIFKSVWKHIEFSKIPVENFKLYEKQKWIDLIMKDDYSITYPQQNLFSPLELFSLLIKVKSGDKGICKSISRYAKFHSTDETYFTLRMIFLLISIKNVDDSIEILKVFIESLEELYENADTDKKQDILLLLDLSKEIEMSVTTDKTNLLSQMAKNRAMKSTTTSMAIVLQYIEEWSLSEINTFIADITTETALSDEDWNSLLGKLIKRDYQTDNDVLFKKALKHADVSTNGWVFVRLQLEKLMKNGAQKALLQKLTFILDTIKCEVPPPKIRNEKWIISFIEFITKNVDIYKTVLPSNIIKSIIPVAIVAFCIQYEQQAARIDRLFPLLLQKIRIISNLEAESEMVSKARSPIKVLEEICELSLLPLKCFDMRVCLKASDAKTGGETFVKVLQQIVVNTAYSQSIGSAEYSKISHRIISVFSTLFTKFGSDLQECGPTSSTPFFMIGSTLESYFKSKFQKSMESEDWEMIECLLNAYLKCTESPKCQKLFIIPKVGELLLGCKYNEEKVKKYADMIKSNTILRTGLLERHRKYEAIISLL